MNTRIATTSDPANAPERNLSSPHLRPVNVSLAIAAQASRVYDPETRAAVLWLANLSANSQRVQLCWQRRKLPDPLGTVGRISEADLSRHLGLDRLEIYRALTGHDEADLPAFTAAVRTFRAKVEAMLPPLVETKDTAIIKAAFAAAGDDHDIVELIGKWRHGKTEEHEHHWLRNLHRAVWVDCPSDNTERAFIFAIARALGISVSGGIKPTQLKEKIRRALGIGLIDTLVIDEAHNLWPADLVGSKPVRIEFIRELRDSLGVGALNITTDQFALSMELAKRHSPRWAPGQFAGRIRQFRLRDKHTDKEVELIARLHAAGPIAPEAVPLFRAFAQAEEGYLGVMVSAIKDARAEAGAGGVITAAMAAAATVKEGSDQQIRDRAAEFQLVRHGRFANRRGKA